MEEFIVNLATNSELLEKKKELEISFEKHKEDLQTLYEIMSEESEIYVRIQEELKNRGQIK